MFLIPPKKSPASTNLSYGVWAERRQTLLQRSKISQPFQADTVITTNLRHSHPEFYCSIPTRFDGTRLFWYKIPPYVGKSD